MWKLAWSLITVAVLWFFIINPIYAYWDSIVYALSHIH